MVAVCSIFCLALLKTPIHLAPFLCTPLPLELIVAALDTQHVHSWSCPVVVPVSHYYIEKNFCELLLILMRVHPPELPPILGRRYDSYYDRMSWLVEAARINKQQEVLGSPLDQGQPTLRSDYSLPSPGRIMLLMSYFNHFQCATSGPSRPASIFFQLWLPQI